MLFFFFFCFFFFFFFVVVVVFVYVPCMRFITYLFFIISGEFDALHQLSVKKDPLEIQHIKLENSKRGFIESVYQRFFRAATRAQRHLLWSLNYLLKRILWKYSIQSLKTADSVLLSPFMRDNGRCDILHAA